MKRHAHTSPEVRGPRLPRRWIATIATVGTLVATTASFGMTSSAGASSGAVASVRALIPAAIRAKGYITVASDATYPPFESIASNGHTIIGSDADLAQALGAVMGIKWKLQNVSFDTIIPGLQDGRYDVGLSGFTDTKSREGIVNLVDYFYAGELFYKKAGSSVTVPNLASLCGKVIAVESGTTEQVALTSQSKACTTSGKAPVKSLVFTNQSETNLAVASGRAILGFADSPVSAYIAKTSHGQFQVVGPTFYSAPDGIAVPKNNGLTKPILAALKVIVANGQYAKVLAKWGLTKGADDSPAVNGAKN